MYSKFPNKITLTKLANCKSVFVIFVKPFREHWLWKVFFNEPALQEPKNLGPALEEYEEPWRERFIRTLKEAGLIKGYWWIFCWKNLLNKALLPGCMAFKFPIEYQGRVETSWAKSCSNWWRCNFLSTWHSLLCWLVRNLVVDIERISGLISSGFEMKCLPRKIWQQQKTSQKRTWLVTPLKINGWFT